MGTILRLLLIGVGTVLGMTVLIAPFVGALASSFGLPLLHLALIGAGMTIVACVIPSFILWYLAAWLLRKTQMSPRRVPVVASALTAAAGAAFITHGITGFAYPSAFGIFAVLAGLSAVIAGLLTFLIFPRPSEMPLT